MPESSDVTNPEPVVGDTVQVTRPDGTAATGAVVEDFGPIEVPDEHLGRTWAPPHRWAVALDDGRLIFVGDSDIAVSPSSTNPPRS